MIEPMSILLFGDQTGDYRTTFRRVLQIQDNPLLTAFFDRSYSVLRQEVANQPRSVREETVGFSSIADLVARYADSELPKTNALESALTYISQIACFFSYQGSGSDVYPSKANSHIVGSCTGLLAAAAVSSSQSAVDLLPVAVEIVKIAYRIGSLVNEVRNQVEQFSTQSSSWSVVLPGIGENDILDTLKGFHEANSIPSSSRAYISAVSPSALTISGPPRVLAQLMEDERLRDKKQVKISIYGPYHASHLYQDYDGESLLRGVPDSLIRSHKPVVPISSTGNQKAFSAENLKDLLSGVTKDILLNPLRWDYVLESVVSAVKSPENASCRVMRFGPSTAGHSLVSALRQEDGIQIELDDRYLDNSDVLGTEQSSANLAFSKIAICGLSGRFPDAADHEAFWALLEKGLDLHREIPKDRFDVASHVDTEGKKTNTSHTPYGCFIEEPGLFDPRFFNISPREAAQTDPMQRLALVTAYEALEMSGYVENRTPSTQLDRVGTFYGQTCDDWREIQAAQKVDTYFIPGGVRAFGPGKINYHFKFSGPSFSVDTACSSSLAAIQLACTSLWAGDCDTAVAGGMNILTNPDIFSGLSRGQFLSKKGPCATFDNDADGYCRADGVGSVVLKRLEDAQADKDPILGVILGAATNHSAEAVSITHPHAGAQEFLYKKVLTAAGVDPHDVSYVEMHGTGTQAGDATEMRSVTRAFAPEHRRRRPDQSLHLGAVKANAGHAEAASGITSLIKVLTMMEKNVIPPHCGIKGTINRTFPKDLKERNVHIAFEPTPWKRPEGKKRRIFLNNFSAAGGNTALLLEDGPISAPIAGKDPRTAHIIAVSARSKVSLRQNVESLISTMDNNSNIDLPSLSYTTTARRMQHNYRTTVVGSDFEKIRAALESSLDREVAQIPSSKRKVAFMFTGQGSHYTSMAKQLFTDSFAFRSNIHKFDKIAKIQGLPSILGLIDGTVTDIGELSPVVVQLGAVCVQMALFKLWTSWGIEPTTVLGHSLGEYAALYAAGVLSASDTIFLVGTRARLLEERCHAGSHAMLAVKGSIASIGQSLDDETFEIACINGPEETVISGTNVNIDMLCEDLKERGFKTTKLKVPFAFHSTQVEAILDDFESSAKGVDFKDPTVPVISPLLSEVITDGSTFGPHYLRRHCRETVNFLGGIEASRHASLVADKSIWLEIGSHPICSTMIKAILGPHVQTTASLRRNDDNWKTLTNSLGMLHDAGLSVDWSEYHRDFDLSHQLLHLSTYKWDNKNYWIEYKNDWTLTKGDAATVAEQEAAKPKFAAASVHRIVEENLSGPKPKIVTESDLCDPLLKDAIDGHEVNGFGLCPPSLYADMALTIADYVYKQLHPNKPMASLNACDMKVEKPLIAQEDGPQLFRVSGAYDGDANRISFDFYSVTSEGKKTITHATCGVVYENAETWLSGWERSTFMVKSRIESLLHGVQNGNNDLIKRGMAYKLFGGLINYGHKYRGMEEVVLNNAELEATSSVAFQTNGTDDKFYCSPYRIDSVAHLSGFIMLGNENANPSKEVYVSHGWETCRFARPLSMDRKYRSYVKMHQESAKMVVGDVYVFEGDSIVAVVEGLRFHGIPRQLMDSILAAAGRKGKISKPAAASAPQQQKPKPKPSPKPKATPAAPAKPKAASTGVTVPAMSILADEVGVPTTDLTDQSAFSEMGVDSLMALTISGKYREALGIEISSSMFVDYPTVKDLKDFLGQNDSSSDEPDDLPDSSSSEESPSRLASPPAETDSASSVGDTDDSTPLECGDSSMTTLIRATIAEETGVALQDIDGSTDLADLGIDSLMTLTISGKIRESTGEELPSDFFAENTTMDAIEASLGVSKKPASKSERVGKEVKPPPATSQASTHPQPDVNVEPKAPTLGSDNATALPRPADSVPTQQPDSTNSSLPSATSLLLQGSTAASRSLFLFPDGSGSPTSYSLLPDISPSSPSSTGKGLAVYALTSPFLHTPESFPPSIPTLTSLYLAEVRHRQPHGPYHLAGWSAGGVIAYEACLQLLAAGQSVERLILIDAPCPFKLGALPPRLHRWFDEVGLLGPSNEGNSTTGTPDWLVPHFDAMVKALEAYSPAKLVEKVGRVPRTYAVWAKDGVCKYPTDPRPPASSSKEEEGQGGMRWLLENREGPQLKFNGWEQLLGDEGIVETAVVEGANHFTMMREGGVEVVGAFVREAMV